MLSTESHQPQLEEALQLIRMETPPPDAPQRVEELIESAIQPYHLDLKDIIIDAGGLRVTKGVRELEPGVARHYVDYVFNHITKNWCESDEERVERNLQAIIDGGTVASSYTYRTEDGKHYPIGVTTDLSIPLDQRDTVIHRLYEDPYPVPIEEDWGIPKRPQPIFKSGAITFTRMAFDVLANNGELAKYVDLHNSGEHGDVREADEMENVWSRIYGGPIVSCYSLELGNLVIRTDLGRDTNVYFDEEDHWSIDELDTDNLPF